MNKKITIILVSLIAIAVIIRAYSAPSQKASIGVVLPLTGTLASVGEDLKNGVQLAAQESGVSIAISDGEANPQKSMIAARQLLVEKSTPVILTAFRGATLSISSTLSQEPVIIAGITGTSEDRIVSTSTDKLFILGPEVVASGEVLGSHAKNNSLCTRPATLIEQTDVAKDKVRGFTRGISIEKDIANEIFDPVATDWRTSILKFKTLSVDCVFVEVRSNSLPILLKQFEEGDFHPKIFTNSYSFTPAAISAAPANQINNLVYSANYMRTGSDQAAFFKKYKEKYGRDATDFAAEAYEFVRMLSTPIRDCSGNVHCIKEKMSAIKNIESSLGNLTVNENREIQLTKYRLFKIVNGVPAEIL